VVLSTAIGLHSKLQSEPILRRSEAGNDTLSPNNLCSDFSGRFFKGWH